MSVLYRLHLNTHWPLLFIYLFIFFWNEIIIWEFTILYIIYDLQSKWSKFVIIPSVYQQIVGTYCAPLLADLFL